MRTLVAVLAATTGRSVERSDKTGVGASARRLPRVCIVRDTHLYIIYLPTYLLRLTDYLHFSPANALTARGHRLRDIRPDL